tara:strand:- start:890 stop:1261 length:372 start_codon:yes stop_codon:yes gene_type:complete
MADFPSLEPSARTLGLGDTPQLLHDSVSGVGVRFVQGSDRVQQRLSLNYEYLTESEAQQIIDHFDDQQGSLIAFDLPSVIWSGYTTPPVSASDYKWLYSGQFEVGIAAPSRYNISVELVTIPI